MKKKRKIDRQGSDRRWIPGYEGIYEINELGQLRSYWINNGNDARQTASDPQRYLTPSRKTLKKYGPRAYVTFYKEDGSREKFYVARLMAYIYLGYDLKDKSKQITMRDGDGMNCRLDNIVIDTPSQRYLTYLNNKYKDNEDTYKVKEGFKVGGYFQLESVKHWNLDTISKEQMLKLLVDVMEDYNLLYEQYGSLND